MEAHSVIDENNYAFPLRLESDKEDGQGLNESGLWESYLSNGISENGHMVVDEETNSSFLDD